MRLLSLAPCLVAITSVLGCATERDPSIDEPTQVSGHGIIGGSLDTTHDAVVYYAHDNSACTATIVAKNGTTGYALTAAHCVGGSNGQLIQADDIDDCFNMGPGCEAVYDVNLVAVHPSYTGDAGDGWDFAMLRFAGAGAITSVIPAAQIPDGLAEGSLVEFVGYGLDDNGNTGVRRHLFNDLSPIPAIGVTDAVSSLFFFQDDSPGLICSGDSGGPGIFNGEVVGVSSFVGTNCTVYGASGRVSTVYNSFIKPFIEGVPPVLNCDECFQASIGGAGACVPAVNACFADTNCEGLVDCINGCNGSQTCINSCANQWSAGINLYNAIFDCTCTACASECSAECAAPNPTSTGTGVDTGTGTGEGTSTDTGTGTGTDTNVGTDTTTGTSTGTTTSKKKKKSSGDADDGGGCSVAATAGSSSDGSSDTNAAWIALVGLMAGFAGLRRSRRSRPRKGRRASSTAAKQKA